MNRLYVQYEFSHISRGWIPVTGHAASGYSYLDHAPTTYSTPHLLTLSYTCHSIPPSSTPHPHPSTPLNPPRPHYSIPHHLTPTYTCHSVPPSTDLPHAPPLTPSTPLTPPLPHFLTPPPTLLPTGQMVLFTSPDDMVIGRSCQVHQREITSRQAARELRTTENLINTALNFRAEKVDLSHFVN